VDGARAAGHPAGLSSLWFKQRFADATGTGRNILPAIRPAKLLRRRTTECHSERL